MKIVEAPNIPVIDLLGAARDPAMPFLARAIDPAQVRRRLECCQPFSDAETMRLSAIRVMRHNPGRRCLIEYDLQVESAALVRLQRGVRGCESYQIRMISYTIIVTRR